MPQNAKSAKLQLIQGNPNKKNVQVLKERAAQEEKMRMPSKNINPPSWLGQEGKKEFRRVAKLLKSVDIISEADISMLATYCDAYERYIELGQLINAMGPVVEGKANPLLTKQKQIYDQMMSVASQFGLTPSARAKLAIKKAEEKREKTMAEKEFGDYL
jgi:P27 family predicted phage terminase small subunit